MQVSYSWLAAAMCWGLWLIFGALAHMDMILKVVETSWTSIPYSYHKVIGIVVIALHQHGRKS